MKKLLLFLFISIMSLSDYYGAIAINTDTGATGYSYDYSSQSSAERAALNYCGQNCEVAIWYKNTCAAVAYSYQNGTYGWAWVRMHEVMKEKLLQIVRGMIVR